MAEEIEITVNGRGHVRSVEPRTTLADFLREDLGLTGTKLGCEHGVCGACTVLVDGEPARSCLALAVRTAGCEVTTVEGLSSPGGLTPLQEAMHRHHGLQCGFCTAGFLVMATALLADGKPLDEADIRLELAGNLCRCTGYHGIVRAIEEVSRA